MDFSLRSFPPDSQQLMMTASPSLFRTHPLPVDRPLPHSRTHHYRRCQSSLNSKEHINKRWYLTPEYPARKETRHYHAIRNNGPQLPARLCVNTTCHASPQSDGTSTSDSHIPVTESAPSELDSKSEQTNKWHDDLSLSNCNSGKSGVATFYSGSYQKSVQSQALQETRENNEAWTSVLWIVGPIALVSSVVAPPILLRKVFELILEESLLTDFLILFFTEAFFYIGVIIFLAIAHKVQQMTGVIAWNSGTQISLGYKVSSYVTMILAVLLPVGAFVIVWPWTGPAAAAALCPYVAGLALQYAFEQVTRERNSAVLPLIPIIFQVYRLHQLNRATQLTAGLLYSLRGAEATAETLAVNGSLSTLVTVLQFLGMLSLWSLTAYLTHIFSLRSQDQLSKVLS